MKSPMLLALVAGLTCTAPLAAAEGDKPAGGKRMTIEQLDLDLDGALSATEAAAAPERMRKALTAADTNTDGTISAEEIAAFKAAMQERRKNGEKGNKPKDSEEGKPKDGGEGGH